MCVWVSLHSIFIHQPMTNNNQLASDSSSNYPACCLFIQHVFNGKIITDCFWMHDLTLTWKCKFVFKCLQMYSVLYSMSTQLPSIPWSLAFHMSGTSTKHVHQCFFKHATIGDWVQSDCKIWRCSQTASLGQADSERRESKHLFSAAILMVRLQYKSQGLVIITSEKCKAEL